LPLRRRRLALPPRLLVLQRGRPQALERQVVRRPVQAPASALVRLVLVSEPAPLGLVRALAREPPQA